MLAQVSSCKFWGFFYGTALGFFIEQLWFRASKAVSWWQRAFSGGVLQKSALKNYSKRFFKIHSKALVPQSLSLLVPCILYVYNFIRTETQGQAFCYEFCQISPDTFFRGYLRITSSGMNMNRHLELLCWGN